MEYFLGRKVEEVARALDYWDKNKRYCSLCDKEVVQPCTQEFCPQRDVKIGSTYRIKIPNNWMVKENKEIKMTREEAVKKCVECGITNPLGIVKSLEALGLIKFEEDIIERDCRDIWVGSARVVAYLAIRGLEEIGYKVEKK